MNDLLIKNLLSDSTTLVVMKEGETYQSELNGIAPLMNLLQTNRSLLQEGMAADRIVGKAAALLFVYGGVKLLYAQTISETACAVLDYYKVDYSYGNKVPIIMNRKGDGMCPMEACVKEENEPSRAYELLTEKIRLMRQNQN